MKNPWKRPIRENPCYPCAFLIFPLAAGVGINHSISRMNKKKSFTAKCNI